MFWFTIQRYSPYFLDSERIVSRSFRSLMFWNSSTASTIGVLADGGSPARSSLAALFSTAK